MIQDTLLLPFCPNPIFGEIKPPGSKSITNRALVLSALAKGKSIIRGYLESEDTNLMIDCLRFIGVKISKKKDCLIIEGRAGNFLPYQKTLFVGNAGTVARFLSPLLALGKGSYILDGSLRMRERPIDELLLAMKKMGIKSKKLTHQSFPLEIQANKISGKEIQLVGNISSQFISALLLVSPFAVEDTYIKITSKITSLYYIEMTRKMMLMFGVRCEWLSDKELFIPAQQIYQAQDYQVEADASAASYFFAMAAISKGSISLLNIPAKSLQGDIGFLQILKSMGCRIKWDVQKIILEGADLMGVEVDMSQQNDVALTLAVLALFASGSTTITNIYNLRLKECDRIHALATELTKIGAKVIETRDSLKIIPTKKYKAVEIDTYQDHRIAMAFSLCSLKIEGMKIKDPLCVQKTYPNYWKNFFSLIS